MSAGVPQCGDDPTGRATPSKQSPVVSLAMEQWIVDSARAPDCAAVAVFVDDAADSGAPFPSSGGQWSRRRQRSTVGPRTPILSREDASGEMPRERLPAGRLGAARASALGTAAKRDGHALRGPRSRSICFLGCRRRLLLRRLEAGRMEDVPVALLGG